jgi:transposase
MRDHHWDLVLYQPPGGLTRNKTWTGSGACDSPSLDVEDAMTVEVTRTEVSAAELRREAGRSSDAAAARRMLAIALVFEGDRRGDAARRCGMDRQTLRDWVHRFNAEGIAGLYNRPHGGGSERKLSAEQEVEIARWVRCGPDPEQDGIVRWRLIDLRARIAREFDVHFHERSVGKVVRRLGFRRVSVRPRHPEADAAAQEAHKKTLPSWSMRRSPRPRAVSRSNSGGKTKPGSVNRAA